MDSDPIAEFVCADDEPQVRLMGEAETAAAAAYIGYGSNDKNDAATGGDASRFRTEDFDFTVNQQHSASRVFVYSWDLPRVFTDHDQLGKWRQRRNTKDEISNALANYMVLLGEGDHFVYLTAVRYLESRWGSVGLAALHLFAAAVDRIKLGGNTILNSDESGLPFETRSGLETYVHFRLLPVLSERRRQLEIAIRWLCAVIRRQPSPESGPSTTRQGADGYQNFVWGTIADNSRTSDGDVCYKLLPWSSTPRHSSSLKPSCWTDLFLRGVVVEAPVPRTWGEGLETTFSTMVTLAGVENMYRINGGVILLGFFTALIPISRHEETNSIQWHLEVDDEGIDPHDLKSTRSNWFRTTDKDVLKSSRCFIGWFEKAHVMLGTSQLVADKARTMRYTRLPDHKETAHRDGGELGAQVSFNTGIVTGTLQAVSTFRYHNNEHRFEAPDQFKQALRRDSGESSLVIDAKERRAWLVPRVSWILHLCHIYYIQQCDHGDTPIPFAEPSSDGAKATISAVTDKGSTIILGEGTEHLETLSELWHRIARNLEATRRCREDPRNGKIFAVEAMDVIQSRNSYPKEIQLSETSQSWAEFAKLPVTATVCAKLGHAILPVPPSGKLCECCALLEKRDLLAAHTWSLARLLEQKGSSVSRLDKEGLSFDNGTSWTVNGGLESLWTKCPAGEDCCSVWGEDPLSSPILQRPKEAGRRKDEGEESDEDPLVNVGRASESGVIVFGGRPTALEASIAVRSLATMTAHFERLRLFPKRKVAGS